jgi:L-lactate dehydrogenase complex protein LldG
MDLRMQFMERASALGARVVQVERPSICDAIVGLAGSAPLGVSGELIDALPELTSCRRGLNDHAEVGAVLGLAGVAALGSVIVGSRCREDRLLWLLAERQIVIVRPSDLIPALEDAGPLIRGWIAEGRRFVTQVAGPSRTSDIERVLTIGVHGPRLLDILLLDDRGADCE